MKQCPNCGQLNDPNAAQCVRCGAVLPPVPPAAPMPPQPAPPVQPIQTQPPPAPSFIPTASMPPRPALPPAFFPRQEPYTWKDICTVLGFAAGLVGYFFASVFLLPLGLVASVIGFRGNRYRGLAVAGVVISAIGVLLKLMVILQQAAFLPNWFTNGIW